MAIKKPQAISITLNSILKILLVVIGVYVLWVIKEIVGLIFIAWVFASSVDPIVDFFQRKRIPRTVTIIGIFIFILAILSLVGVLLVPPLVTELNEIATVAPGYIEQFKGLQESIPFDLASSIKAVSDQLAGLSSQVIGFVISIFGGIITFLGVIVLVFYMTVEENALKRFVQSVSPLSYQPYILKKIQEVQTKMGAWLRGQIVLMLIIGSLSYIGLLIIDVEYALVLALLAGLLEFIPVLGPILAAIPAVFFALVQSPWKALFVIILFILIQQLENHLIVPNVMRRSVGINPLLTIIALLIGAKIAGVVGMLLAVPVVVIIMVFFGDLFDTKKREENKLEK